MKQKRQYDEAFKQAAVLLVMEQGYGMTQAAEAVDTSVKNLQRWKQQYTQTGSVTGGLNAEERSERLRLRRENHQLRMEKEILKKASAFFCAGNEVKYRFIQQLPKPYPTRLACRVMKVSHSAYYDAWRKSLARSKPLNFTVWRLRLRLQCQVIQDTCLRDFCSKATGAKLPLAVCNRWWL